jgi:hypothetical protein
VVVSANNFLCVVIILNFFMLCGWYLNKKTRRMIFAGSLK